MHKSNNSSILESNDLEIPSNPVMSKQKPEVLNLSLLSPNLSQIFKSRKESTKKEIDSSNRIKQLNLDLKKQERNFIFERREHKSQGDNRRVQKMLRDWIWEEGGW